jgi:hypothetical protein
MLILDAMDCLSNKPSSIGAQLDEQPSGGFADGIIVLALKPSPTERPTSDQRPTYEKNWRPGKRYLPCRKTCPASVLGCRRPGAAQNANAFKKVDLRAVRQFQAEAIRPDQTTVVVVGDVSPEEARAVIEKWFGGWKAVGPTPNTILPPVPLNNASSVHIPDTGATQDSVIIAERPDDFVQVVRGPSIR